MTLEYNTHGSSGRNAAGNPAAAAAMRDPFGLWSLPGEASASEAAASEAAGNPAAGSSDAVFGIEAGSAPASAPAAVWLLALSSRGGPPVLAQRAQRLTAVEQGLARAPVRMESAFAQAAAGQISFGLPEQQLAAYANPTAAGAVSYGLLSPDWEALSARCMAMFDSVNRQVLHFVWVDTTLDGQLAARTVVGWHGDVSNCTRTGLPAPLVAEHRRSFDLAMLSRTASLRAAVTTIQLAARIGLLVASPVAPLQALALAWQFVEAMIAEAET